MGAIEHIHVTSMAGRPMRSRDHAEAVAHAGLEGDRYRHGIGYFRDSRVSRDLTLIEAEVIDDLARRSGVVLEPGETRRNVTTRGVSLDELVGRSFWLGDVLCRGTSLCEPCRHLEELTGRSLLRPMIHRGGLRAEILIGGTIHVNDEVEPVDELIGVGVVVGRGRKVLLGRRLAAHGFGMWSTPGGAPLAGETVQDCALRELREETGLRGDRPRVIAETVDGFAESRLVYRSFFVEMGNAAGEPVAGEPEKTQRWCWYDWDELPRPLFTPVSSLVATGYRPIRHH
jgi:ADP-ribose pyrophosphatase YjhB (NUDIX family)